MSIEVISGIGIILIVAIWAAFYIYKRNRENNLMSIYLTSFPIFSLRLEYYLHS
jgi:hypothetical protein